MKRYIAVLEIDNDEEIVGSIDATVSYTYRRNGTNYATTGSVEFKEESEKTYEDGLNEAWEAARKIVCLPSDGGHTPSTLIKIFGHDHQSTILKQNTAAEAVAKINEHENRIEVGDEVKYRSVVGVVLELHDDNSTSVMRTNGNVSTIYNKRELKKTGRHFPQIEELLQKMQEGNE